VNGNVHAEKYEDIRMLIPNKDTECKYAFYDKLHMNVYF